MTDLTIKEALSYLKESFGIDMHLEHLRLFLKKENLLFSIDGYHFYIREPDVKKIGELLTSPLVLAEQARISGYTYHQLYYACLKLGISLEKHAGRYMFKNKEDLERAIEFCRKSKKNVKK